MKYVKVPTFIAQIYVGGSLSVALRVCREFCDENPECVTVEPISYVYVGGSTDGVRVGFINYGRFPRDDGDIMDQAHKLARILIEELGQESASIVTTTDTIWITKREDA